MADNSWKKRIGVVYSTDPDFKYTEQTEQEPETLEPGRQKLIVGIDRRNRSGKQVTLVTGFIGRDEDLANAGREEAQKTGKSSYKATSATESWRYSRQPAIKPNGEIEKTVNHAARTGHN